MNNHNILQNRLVTVQSSYNVSTLREINAWFYNVSILRERNAWFYFQYEVVNIFILWGFISFHSNNTMHENSYSYTTSFIKNVFILSNELFL